MQKIYKRGVLENRLTLAAIMATTSAITTTILLVLFDEIKHWPIIMLIAAATGFVYGRICRPYEVTTSAGRIVFLVSLNAAILLTCILLF